MKTGERAQATARKLLKRLSWSLAALAAVLALATWGLLSWLATPSGEARLRDQVLSAVNGAIAGRLAVEGLEMGRPGELVLTDVALYDPEGRLVARAERIEAAVDLLQLAEKRVHLRRVALRSGELLLVEDPEGLNLVRAVAARHPGAPRQDPGSFDWDLTIDAASAAGVRLEYRPSRDAPAAARIDDVRLEGSGRYRRGGTALSAELNGAIAAPLSGPLSIVVAAHGGSPRSPHDPLTIDRLDVRAGSSRARLTGLFSAGELEATLAELVLARRDLLAVSPGLPVASDLFAAGRATLDAHRATVALSMPALALEASARLSPFSVEAVARLAGLDLARWVDGAPSTRLEGTVSGHFALGDPKPGHGELALKLSRSLVRGVAVAQTTGTVALHGHRILPDLVVGLPGGKASVTGSLSLRQLDLEALLAVADLQQLTDAVAQLAGSEAPRLQGAGTLTARITGSARAPAVHLAGSLSRFEAGAFDVEGLRVEAALPNARRLTAFDASVHADKGTVSELPFARLDARVRADGRRFDADLSTTGMAGATARLAGELDRDQRGGRLGELTLSTKDSRWQLESPAVVDLRGGVRVDCLTLRSGEQSLQASGGLSRGVLDLEVAARQLDLSKLPKVLVHPRWRLTGLVSASGRLSGPLRRPELGATVAAAGLGGFGLDSIDLTATANLSADRLRGTASLKRLGATAEASADLPRQLLDAPPSAPASASIDLENLPLRWLAERAGFPGPSRGTGRLTARLTGTAEQPRLEASVQLSDAMWDGVPAAGLDLQLAIDRDATAKATLQTAGGPVQLQGFASLSLRALASRPPLDRLRAVPFTAELRAPSFVLGAFEGSLLPAGTAGTATLGATFDGSVSRPRGEVQVSVENGAFGLLKGLAANASLVADDKGLELTADSTLLSQPLAHVEARLGSPAEALGSVAALSAAPAEATVDLGPTGLESLLPADGAAAHGTLLGNARLSGTLASPLVEWGLRVENLRSGLQPLARLAATGGYRDATARASVTVEAAKGGAAQAHGTLRADLSLPSLERGVPWAQAPVEAALDAKSLDLAVLEGLSRSLRSVAGTLSGEASLAGTLGAPSARGALSLREGAFQIPGYGTYRDVSLQLSVSDRRIDVPALTGRAGNGTVSLSLSGERASTAEPYRLTAHLAVSDAPLVVEDQLVAHLTGETGVVTGELSASRAALDVQVSRLVVDLPQASSKDLQGLDRNPDIVIVGGPLLGKRKVEGGAARTSTGGGGGYPLVVVAHAPGNLWIQSSDAKIEAAADVRAVVGKGPAELTGSVKTLQGRVDVLGRRFELAAGRVSWSGEPPNNPRLDVQAVYENLREQVKVLVHVTGRARSPRIEMSSEPPLDEQQIATLLATGRRDLKRGSAGVASGGAASVLTSLAADRLRRALATRLPLDVLQVEVGDQGLRATQLEAGTYLTDQVYVGYRRDFGADTERGQNANEVRVEYQISPHVSIESQYGDAGRGGANVVYTRDY